MGMVPENLEWLLAFIYGVAPGIVAWSVPGGFSLAWLRGFLPGSVWAWFGGPGLDGRRAPGIYMQ